MRIIAKRTLKEFWNIHPDAEHPLLEWFDEASDTDWNTPNEVKATFGNASILTSTRVIFNIKGNDYRLITHIDFTYKMIFIILIGKHADYDRIDAKSIEFKKR